MLDAWTLSSRQVPKAQLTDASGLHSCERGVVPERLRRGPVADWISNMTLRFERRKIRA